MPVCFLYGQWDWMSRATADKMAEAGLLKDGSVVRTVEKAGHHLYVENGEGCVGEIYEFIFGLERKRAFFDEVGYEEIMRQNENDGSREPVR